MCLPIILNEDDVVKMSNFDQLCKQISSSKKINCACKWLLKVSETFLLYKNIDFTVLEMESTSISTIL